MSHSFTQIYTQLIFSVKDNKRFIDAEKEAIVYNYLSELLENSGNQPLIIDGTSDHIHILLKLNPANAISDLVRNLKRQSSYYINHQLLNKPSFHWQVGYSAFSYTRSQVNAVYKFIERQKEYHQNKNFQEEYLEISEWDDNHIPKESIFKYKYQ